MKRTIAPPLKEEEMMQMHRVLLQWPLSEGSNESTPQHLLVFLMVRRGFCLAWVVVVYVTLRYLREDRSESYQAVPCHRRCRATVHESWNLPHFFKSFWDHRMALDRRNFRQLVDTTVEIANRVGAAEIIARPVDDLKVSWFRSFYFVSAITRFCLMQDENVHGNRQENHGHPGRCWCRRSSGGAACRRHPLRFPRADHRRRCDVERLRYHSQLSY